MRDTKMTTYSFGYNSEDGVEIPELDAFIADFRIVCERHGIGLSLESDYDSGRGKVILVPFPDAEFDFITADLNEYARGIPWLDQAKAEYKRRGDERRAAERQREKSLASQRKAAQEAAVLKEGVVVGGKRYKLVAADDA